MSLTSFSFIGVYFPLLLIAYYNPVFKNNTFRNVILLLASLGLYTFTEPVYIFLLLVSILINYLFVYLVKRTGRKIFEYIVIGIDVLILFFFKYLNKGTFPVGLSYFTFKEISYVVDSVNSDKEYDLMDCALYIANFITITSGPLAFFNDEIKDIGERKNDLRKGFERMIRGLCKKVVIADSISPLVNICFMMNDRSLLMAWTGIICFALRLYFDFSGYSDIAIGVGHLFGYDLPENFDLPYCARSVSDFWKRWHMSLTRWFTRYLYIPLGGSRVSRYRHIFNLFAVWLCTGLWHGSGFNFIIWGMIFFVFQTLEKYTGIDTILDRYHLGHIYTLLIVLISWVFFNTQSTGEALSYIRSMFVISDNGLIGTSDFMIIRNYMLPLLLGTVLSTRFALYLDKNIDSNRKMNSIYHIVLIMMFVVCLIVMLGRGYIAPMYAGF